MQWLPELFFDVNPISIVTEQLFLSKYHLLYTNRKNFLCRSIFTIEPWLDFQRSGRYKLSKLGTKQYLCVFCVFDVSSQIKPTSNRCKLHFSGTLRTGSCQIVENRAKVLFRILTGIKSSFDWYTKDGVSKEKVVQLLWRLD